MKRSTVVLVFFSGAFLLLAWPLLSPKVLLPSDLIEQSIPLASGPAAVPHNNVVSDVVEQFYPYQFFLRSELKAGRLPLWNPYVLNGEPFLANSVSAPFSPLLWLLLALPLDVSYEWAALLKLVVAGLGFFWFSRCLGLSNSVSLLVGFSYMFGGYQIYFLLYPNSSVSMWLGWLLWATERLSRNPGLLGVGRLGLLVALSLLGGHLESSLLTLMAVGVYGLVRNWRYCYQVILAITLGVLAAAVAILPFLEFLLQSATLVQRSGGLRNPFFVEPVKWPALVLPYLLGSPVQQPGSFEMFEGAIYLGLIPLLLVCASLPGSLGGGVRRTLWLLAGGALLLLFGIWPFFDLFTAMPLLRQGNHFHVAQILQGSLAVLAGYGLTRWGRRRWQWKRVLSVSVYGGGTLLVSSYFYIQPGWNPDAAAGSFFFFASRFPYPLYPLWVLITLLAFVGAGRLGVLVPASIGLVVLNGLIFGMFFNSVSSAWKSTERTPPVVEQMQQDPHARFAALGVGTLPPNWGMRWKLRDIRGYESLLADRIPPFYALLTDGRFDPHQFLEAIDDRKLALLRRAGVGLLLSPESLQLEGLRPLRTEFPRLYKVERGGRLHWSSRVMWASSAEEALRLVAADPHSDIPILEGEPVSEASQYSSQTAVAEWVQDEPDKIEIVVKAPAEGWLVLRDTYFPGWEARVDGHPVQIRRADYLFRAVAVPAGQHRVHFEYRPWSVPLGGALSILAVLGLSGLCWWGRGRAGVSSLSQPVV